MIYNNIFDIEKHICRTHTKFAGHRITRMSGSVWVFDTLARLNDAINNSTAMIGAGFEAEIMVDGKTVKTLIDINRISGDMYNGVWEVTEQIA